ncbi:hypothetical protein KC221_26960, partial [Mycobacterium tuberculosis]|nr:hypothetical protein [Mycobacterium tuberculosis]
MTVTSNTLGLQNSYYVFNKNEWNPVISSFLPAIGNVAVDPALYFNTGEKIIINGLQFGAAQDETISGN